MALLDRGYNAQKHRLSIKHVGCSRVDGYGDLCIVTYIQNMKERSFIIDCGNNNNIDKKIFLEEYNNVKDKLDWILYTHWHNDHYGGSLQNLKNKLVFGLTKNAGPNRDAVVQAVKNITAIENTDYFVDQTKTVLSANPLQIRIIAPVINNTQYKDENHYSLMPEIRCNTFAYLGLGDITKETFPKNLSQNGIKYTVIKLPHHGSEGNISKNESLSKYIKNNKPLCIISGLSDGGCVSVIQSLLNQNVYVVAVIGDCGAVSKIVSFQNEWNSTGRFCLVDRLTVDVDSDGNYRLTGKRKLALPYGQGMKDL